MIDGYIRMMVSRFWEERRLTHPHLSLLYDLVHEIIRNANIPDNLKKEYTARLEKAKRVRLGGKRINEVWVGGVVVDLPYLEIVYHRNHREALDVDIDVDGGSVAVKDIDLSTKRVLSHLTEIVSDVGKLYYMDVQFKNINPQSEMNTVMEKL